MSQYNAPSKINKGCSLVIKKYKEKFNFIDIISPPKRSALVSTYKLSHTEQLYIALAINFDPDYDSCHKANALLVASYRALDIESVFYKEYLIDIVESLIEKISFEGKKENVTNVKFDKSHVSVSLSFVLLQMGIALKNKAVFVKGIEYALKTVLNDQGGYLKNSFYSINMILNLLALYFKGDVDVIDKLFFINLQLSKISYGYHDNYTPWTRYKELSFSINNLSILKEYQSGNINISDKLFRSSVRCSNKELYYNNFKSFKVDNKNSLYSIVDSLYLQLQKEKL